MSTLEELQAEVADLEAQEQAAVDAAEGEGMAVPDEPRDTTLDELLEQLGVFGKSDEVVFAKLDDFLTTKESAEVKDRAVQAALVQYMREHGVRTEFSWL